MKRIRLLALIAIIAICLVSCSTFSSFTEEERDVPGGQSTIPTRYIAVDDMTDLDNSKYEILGEVSGTGRVNAYNPEQGDTHKYGKLLLNEFGDNFEHVTLASTDPYDVSLGNALYEVINNARTIGAHFIIYPSYTVEFTDSGEIITNATAVAVRVVPN